MKRRNNHGIKKAPTRGLFQILSRGGVLIGEDGGEVFLGTAVKFVGFVLAEGGGECTLDAYADERVRVRYGSETQSGTVFYLNDRDKKALLQSYHLAILISDIKELEKRIRITSLQIEKYQKRLQKK